MRDKSHYTALLDCHYATGLGEAGEDALVDTYVAMLNDHPRKLARLFREYAAKCKE